MAKPTPKLNQRKSKDDYDTSPSIEDQIKINTQKVEQEIDNKLETKFIPIPQSAGPVLANFDGNGNSAQSLKERKSSFRVQERAQVIKSHNVLGLYDTPFGDRCDFRSASSSTNIKIIKEKRSDNKSNENEQVVIDLCNQNEIIRGIYEPSLKYTIAVSHDFSDIGHRLSDNNPMLFTSVSDVGAFR